MAVLGLRFCARAFSSCGKRGPLFITVRGPLTIAASLVAEHRLQTHRLSNYGSRAQPLRGMWDLPRSGLEPVSPALAGGFSTTAPPRKPWDFIHFLPVAFGYDAFGYALFHSLQCCLQLCFSPSCCPQCCHCDLSDIQICNITSLLKKGYKEKGHGYKLTFARKPWPWADICSTYYTQCDKSYVWTM